MPRPTVPRAGALTDALIDPGAVAVGAEEVSSIARRLRRGLVEVVELAGLAGRRAGAGGNPETTCVRIGAYHLVSPEGWRARSKTAPFRWTARTARRAIGVSGVRAVLEGHAPTPAEAVGLVVSDPSGPLGVGASGRGSCADWLGSLAPAAKALVRAEATTWATQLWTAIEWERLDPAPLVGPPDRWWVQPTPRVRVALRGRADVRLSGPRGAEVTMLSGHPTPASRMALCLSALVDVLARGAPGAPCRVLGWWPESGKAWAVPVDAAALCDVVDATLRAAAAQLAALAAQPDNRAVAAMVAPPHADP